MFSIFGGLRTGEVVNLTKEAIESPYFWDNTNLGENKFILKIRERHKELFQNKTNLQHEGVKRPRNQALLTNPLLSQVYKEHKQYLERLNNQKHKTQMHCSLPKEQAKPCRGKLIQSYSTKLKRIFTKPK